MVNFFQKSVNVSEIQRAIRPFFLSEIRKLSFFLKYFNTFFSVYLRSLIGSFLTVCWLGFLFFLFKQLKNITTGQKIRKFFFENFNSVSFFRNQFCLSCLIH